MPSCVAGTSLAGEAAICPAATESGDISIGSGRRRSRSGLETVRQEGLLHDARNLMGAIGLYCDLLSMPDVLRPEHHHYAEELRLLGARSSALIQQLMQHQLLASVAHGVAVRGLDMGVAWETAVPRSLALTKVREAEGGPVASPFSLPGAVSLRAVVERCSGLLSRVADGRTIEVSYGAAASVPVAIAEEAVERILVNLVRNSAIAMRGPAQSGGLAGDTPGGAVGKTVLDRSAGRKADETGAIRIEVGLPINRVEDPRPWPLRRVRLTVEDSGCGMTAEQMERLLSVNRGPSRGSHGIGFRVVRELVAASSGEMRVMSVPGAGTRVQIEWPVTTVAREETAGKRSVSRRTAASGPLAAASGLPVPELARRAIHAPEGLGAVEADSVPRSHGEFAAGDVRWTIC
jgi:signal transduction histidine kinase